VCTRLTQLYLLVEYKVYKVFSKYVFHVQPEDDHYQVPKHVVISYVENTLYSTNKYSCFRRVHTLCIGYDVYEVIHK